MTVILGRDAGDLARTHRLGLARFEAQVRREITKQGRQKPCLRIARNLYAVLTDPTGVTAHRRGAFERVQLLLEDWTDTPILAETGDPTRFATARALVKHAGLAPRQKESGTFTGKIKLTGQGRPKLRLAAWRAVWGALQTNTAYAARYRHLTTREHNKFTPTQAQAVIAAAILRHLHAIIATGQAWDPVIATHGTHGAGQNVGGHDGCLASISPPAGGCASS